MKINKNNLRALIAEAKELVASGNYENPRNIQLVQALAELDQLKKDEGARYPSTVLFGDALNMESFRAALIRSLEILAPALLAEHPQVAECLKHFPTYEKHDLPKLSDHAILSEYLQYYLKNLSVKQVAAIAAMTLDTVIEGMAYAEALASLGRELRPVDSIAGVYHTSRIGRRRGLGLK